MGMFQERYGRKFGVSKLLALSALATLAIAGISQSSHAALVASDNAGNYGTSTGGWSATGGADNLGSGFGGWTFSANPNGGSAGAFLANTTSLLGANPPIATSGNSWGVYANGGSGNSNINITRGFLPGVGSSATVGTLRDGQTFSIDLASAGVGGSGSAFGFNLQEAGGAVTPFTLKYQAGGSDAMTLIDASGSYTVSGVNFSDLSAGINVSFTLGGSAAGGNQNYTLSIDNTSGTSLATHSGVVSGALNQFEVFDTNTAGNGYFNSIAVTGSPISATPLPATFALVLAGGIALATMGLNRRRSNIKA